MSPKTLHSLLFHSDSIKSRFLLFLSWTSPQGQQVSWLLMTNLNSTMAHSFGYEIKIVPVGCSADTLLKTFFTATIALISFPSNRTHRNRRPNQKSPDVSINWAPLLPKRRRRGIQSERLGRDDDANIPMETMKATKTKQ